MSCLLFGLRTLVRLGYLHDLTVKNRIKPKISTRPRSMVAVRTHLPRTGIWPKLLIEPTIPKPGPTFPMVAADPENAVRLSMPSAVNTRLERNTIPIYREIYNMPASSTSSLIAPLLIFGVMTALGCFIFLILFVIAFQQITILSTLIPPEVELA